MGRGSSSESARLYPTKPEIVALPDCTRVSDARPIAAEPARAHNIGYHASSLPPRGLEGTLTFARDTQSEKFQIDRLRRILTNTGSFYTETPTTIKK